MARPRSWARNTTGQYDERSPPCVAHIMSLIANGGMLAFKTRCPGWESMLAAISRPTGGAAKFVVFPVFPP